jgi:light-regulated signal transduction histidine kinase (bacteriophytochrome)
MNTLLRDLLEYSRVGQDAMPAAVVNAHTAANNALLGLEPRVIETGAHVAVGPLPVVRGREHQLEQVFQNLIENAIKYRRQGVTPRIEIQAVNTGEMWQFSVSDNGTGFDMAYSDRIFRVFQRLHGRAEYTGNGIGLSIAKRIVERHGGRMWVDWSEPGQGARFCFTLPALPQNRIGAHPAESPNRSLIPADRASM